MVFIAWEILNDTKQYGRFGYVHAKNKEKALKRARILFWQKGVCCRSFASLVDARQFLVWYNVTVEVDMCRTEVVVP